MPRDRCVKSILALLLLALSGSTAFGADPTPAVAAVAAVPEGYRLRAGDTLTVEADVENTGAADGDEVAELYLAPPHTAVSPTVALAGFERVHILEGRTAHVVFHLDARTLSQVDAEGVRAVSPGQYRIYVGGSQPSGDAGSAVRSEEFTVAGAKELPR